jgi:hypothetical protein
MITAMIAITYLAAATGLLVLLISETSRTDSPVAWPELLMLAMAWWSCFALCSVNPTTLIES